MSSYCVTYLHPQRSPSTDSLDTWYGSSYHLNKRMRINFEPWNMIQTAQVTYMQVDASGGAWIAAFARRQEIQSLVMCLVGAPRLASSSCT